MLLSVLIQDNSVVFVETRREEFGVDQHFVIIAIVLLLLRMDELLR